MSDASMAETVGSVLTGTLEIAYEQHGPADGAAVVLLHGFPDDVRAWDEVTPRLATAGCRVIVRTCAGTGRRASSMRARRASDSKPPSGRT
jgi:pimeloyl-ACP methyl ester carboxylesterase